MELRHLRYFAAVAEHLSFRRAAEQLHLTRPALSKQVKELEQELGVRLLDRTTARVRLTQAGAVYLVEARAILALTAQATERAREAAAGKRGVLTIGDIGMLSVDMLSPALTRFREAFPLVDVVLKELPLPQQLAALEAGDIQVAFALPEQLRGRAGFRSVTVRQLRVGLATARGHPLAARSQVGLKDVLDQPLLCIGTPARSEHADHVRQLLATIGAANKPIQTVGTLPSLLTMLASGLGVSFLPEAITSHWPGVRVVPFQNRVPQLDFELKAAWHAHEQLPLVKHFVQILRRVAVPS
jgi:LysR family transcriptional regulator, benzoate and cis,cis-muconate-responsive activator of ben and cat genes